MAHANPVAGSTVYIDEPTNAGLGGVVPEDTVTVDGYETAVHFVGPGLFMETIDLDT